MAAYFTAVPLIKACLPVALSRGWRGTVLLCGGGRGGTAAHSVCCSAHEPPLSVFRPRGSARRAGGRAVTTLRERHLGGPRRLCTGAIGLGPRTGFSVCRADSRPTSCRFAQRSDLRSHGVAGASHQPIAGSPTAAVCHLPARERCGVFLNGEVVPTTNARSHIRPIICQPHCT